MILESPVEDVGRWLVLVVLCVAASVTDVVSRKVPNWLTVPAMVLGLGAMLVHRGPDGLVNGVLAGFTCFAFMMILRAIGGLGGGDVKLLTAVGCAGGWPFVGWAAGFGFFIGGVMGVVALIWKKNMFEALGREIGRLVRLRLGDPAEGQPIPYAVALAAGTLIALARDAGFVARYLEW